METKITGENCKIETFDFKRNLNPAKALKVGSFRKIDADYLSILKTGRYLVKRGRILFAIEKYLILIKNSSGKFKIHKGWSSKKDVLSSNQLHYYTDICLYNARTFLDELSAQDIINKWDDLYGTTEIISIKKINKN